MYRELRVYTVNPGAMDSWTAEWRERVYPLRRKLGFSIPAAWVVEGEDLFVWLLEYGGADYQAANEAYYASPERQALEPDPARHLVRTQHWPLRQIV